MKVCWLRDLILKVFAGWKENYQSWISVKIQKLSSNITYSTSEEKYIRLTKDENYPLNSNQVIITFCEISSPHCNHKTLN